MRSSRLFYLLSFLYDAKSILRAREALCSPVESQRAYALEMIDSQLPADLKSKVLPVLEELSPTERVARLSTPYPQPRVTHEARLQSLIAGPEAVWFTAWAQACTVYTAGWLTFPSCQTAMVTAAAAPDPLVRQTAYWALAQFDPSKGTTRLSTIEKVIILKTVGMFSQTPGAVLAEVADLLEEIEAADSETIFNKGDLGDSPVP